LYSQTKGTPLKPIELFVNRVIHGDCITVMQSMPSESVDLVVTDPPYIVNYTPRDRRRCTNDDNGEWLRPAFQEIYRLLKPSRLCVSFYGWPLADRFMQVWKTCGFRPVSHLTWVKAHCSREGYSRSFHEVGFLLAKGRPERPLRPPPDVLPWEYTSNELHTNQKPVVALTPLIEAYSKQGDLILDPFAGSGSTGVAAKRCGRHFILIEKVWRHHATAMSRLTRGMK
jgi:site-specific DNA-methyltransferase (adenine-specific)